MRYGLLALIASVGMVALAACGGNDDSDEPPSVEVGGNGNGNGEDGEEEEPGFMGAKVNPHIPKPDMSLTDTNGEDYDIQEETEGYLTLLYFGYTNCPDICPTHMQDISTVMADMSEEQREKIKLVFVTTDPENDTPERLREWLDLFNENFVGLTGSQEQIDNLQKAVGIAPTGDPATHAAYLMAFTPESNTAPLVYPSGVTREMWANDLSLLLDPGFEAIEGTQG